MLVTQLRSTRALGFRNSVVSSLIIVATLLSQPLRAEEKSLADQIPRIPSKTVAESLKIFRLQNGFSLQIVAAEPDVVDPIDVAFDESGRMYVVEMNDYPFLPEQRVQKYKDQRPETWGRIRLLTDTDGDGQMDKSVIFADHLRWPQSVICSQGGIFVLTPPNLLFLKDTNGDGIADQQEVICTGFASGNVQGLANGLEWGRDNAIYFASGMAGGELTVPARGNKAEYKFTPGRRDLRLDPKTLEFTMASGGQQYGHTIDDWGNRFICSNSNHIVHVTWPLNYIERNPLLAVSEMTRAIAKEGAAARVFRTSEPEPWRIVRTARRAADPEMRKKLPESELVPTGFFTSATGVTIYRGGVYGPEYQGNAFVGDCGSNLVHRKKLTPQGISFVAERADKDVEFLTSTDNWFRPVNFVNAPDGTLYVIDMYRETIEHPFSIPDDIKALVDLESGYDKGRIWRLVPPDYKRTSPPNLSTATAAQLVEHLRSPHGWIRDTAQRLLVERMDTSVVDALRKLTHDVQGTTPQARLHALWTLSGLGAINESDLLVSLRDPDDHLREQALILVARRTEKSPQLEAATVALAQDPAARVRWQLAFTLGELSPETLTAGLKALAVEAAKDPDLRTAWFSSVYPHMGGMALLLIAQENPETKPLLLDLVRLIGSAKNPKDSELLLVAMVSPAVPDSIRAPVLVELGEGLRRRGTTISQIVTKSLSAAAIQSELDKCYQRADVVIRDEKAAEPDRLKSIRLLAFADPTLAQKTLPGLFTPQAPPALQIAAVTSLARHGTDAAFSTILEAWPGFGPNTRREIVDNLVQSVRGTTALLKAVEASTIKPREIERDQRQLLVNHPNTTIRELAKTVLAEPPSNRKEVVTKFQPVLELKGDPARGKQLFAKTCMQCHRAGTAGHQVGPDFASVQNKSEADLLIAILDPNREALPKFQTYTAITKQGKIFTGIIASETSSSLTLKRAEAKEDVILRETVDELVSNGTSLMPEGLEKDLDQQQLADIIAAIKSGS